MVGISPIELLDVELNKFVLPGPDPDVSWSPPHNWSDQRSMRQFALPGKDTPELANHPARAGNRENQPTGCGKEGCVENGPAATLLVGYVRVQIGSLLPPVRLGPPCRRPIFIATIYYFGDRTIPAPVGAAQPGLLSFTPSAPVVWTFA